jgi:hypothetical protein
LTWTLRAAGVGPGRQRSDRLIGIGVILYMLGLSYRAVEAFLPCLGCQGSKSGIERDVTRAGAKARQLHQAGRSLPVRVLGVDGTGAAMAGQNAGLLFFADIDGQKLLCVKAVREEQARRVRQHVAKVMAQVGAQQLRSDENAVYHGIVDEARHGICLAHWRKSKGKRAFDLYRQASAQGQAREAEHMRQLLALLRLRPRPPTVPAELDHLVRRYSRCREGLRGKINQLLQHVERTWQKVSSDPVDPTNNVTERLIGLTLKIRAKTMRGFKARHKVLAHPYLASFLAGQAGVCDVRPLLN